MMKLFSVCFALITAIASSAQAQLRMPVWPQAFAVEKGETATFAVPVTQKGAIEVSITWQGGPLTIAFKNAANSMGGNPITVTGPIAKANLPVTDAMLQRGNIWGIVLSGTDSARRQGQISIVSPPVNEAQLAASTRSLMRIREKPSDAQLVTMAHPQTLNFLKRRDAFNKVRMDRLATMNAVAQSYTTRMATSSSGSLRTSIALSSARKTGTTPASHLQPQVVQVAADISRLLQTPQSLSSVMPVSGKPGTKVVLTGVNLLPDSFFNTANADIRTYWQGAMFKIAAAVEKPGVLSNPRKNPDGTISIDAAVPNGPGLIDMYNGTVCLYSASAKTNTVPFKFIPSGLPTITSLAPSGAGPSDLVALKGYYFSRDDKVFIDIGAGDQELPFTYISDKEVRVYMPEYISRTPINARIYIAHLYSYGWDGGAPQWLMLSPTEITISAVNYVAGSSMASSNPQGQPRDPIVITGTGFVNPVVHFIIGNGIDKTAPVDFSDGTTIRTSVPDVGGIAADYAGSIYVVCGAKKSNLVNFTFHPELEYKILDMYRFRPDGIGEMVFSAKQKFDWWALLPTEDPKYPNDTSKWTADELAATHAGDFLWGYRVDDFYYQTKRLKNNWKVDYIDLTFKADNFGGGARLDGARLGTDSPYAKVHWWVEALSYVDYYITWHIVGPKGCSYY